MPENDAETRGKATWHVRFSLEEYAEGARDGWDYASLYGAMVHEIPRMLNGMSDEQRRPEIERTPTGTGTVWDVLIAAMIEHCARLHGDKIPEWTEEPCRFLDTPCKLCKLPEAQWNAAFLGPGAFIRHGVLIDPRDLDARGGERIDWTGED